MSNTITTHKIKVTFMVELSHLPEELAKEHIEDELSYTDFEVKDLNVEIIESVTEPAEDPNIED